MSNAQCEAIIKAISVATEFLFANGIPLWKEKGDASANATAMNDALDGFETRIEQIVSDLPDETPEP